MAENGHPLNVLGVEQDFSFPTLYSAQRKVNKQNISIAKTTLLRKTQLLAKDISQAYFEILYLLNKQNIYQKIDSMYSKFGESESFRYEQGDIGYMQLLNSKAIQQQIGIQINEINYNLAIGYEKLKAIMQYDSAFVVPFKSLELVPLAINNIESSTEVRMKIQETEHQNALLRVERNRLIPDLKLSYFNGTNKYEGSKNYQGVMLGLAVPLFFGEQKARIKANKIAVDIRENLQEHYVSTLNAKYAELMFELKKYQASLDMYNSSGLDLSREIIRSAQKSYEVGEIDFFQFVLSIENGLTLTIDYLDNVAKYNQVALEINYLTR